MYLGRFQLGQELVVDHLTVDSQRVPVAPDAVPTVSLYYGTSGAKLLARQPMTALDRYRTPNLFRWRLFLNATYGVGPWAAVVTYQIAGAAVLVAHLFEIVDGGDAAGHVISMVPFERPEANYLVQRCDGGLRIFGRNPSV